MVVDAVYQNAGNVTSAFEFDDEAIKKALLKIYSEDFHPVTEIEENLFRGIWDAFNDATDKGFGTPDASDPDFDFVHELKTNNAVFAAFKVHRAQNDMAALLHDANGNLRPFNEWVKDALPIADHQCRHWLKTEYDTAVIRAHQAADWRQFEREKHILPNLKWGRSTSITPGADHMVFWGTILPIEHPLWKKHRPGDRWNCKCSLTSTNEPATAVPDGGDGDKPADGLDNNPGIDGKLFGSTHPYVKHAYKGAEKAVSKYIAEKVKDNTIRIVSGKIDPKTGRELDWSGKHLIDKEYGKRLLTHVKADETEIADNTVTAKTLLTSFPKLKIKIREHIIEKGVKNPEYEVGRRIADAKRIHSEKGITAGFKKAIAQGCNAVIIDFDKFMQDKQLHLNQVARYIDWRRDDFNNGTIKECYVVHRGKAVVITKKHSTREKILKELEKLKP